MSTYRQDLERMLRWYPRRWREEHGPAFVGIHLDAVAEDGDEAPAGALSRQDKVAIRSAGLFERTRYTVPLIAAGTAAVATGTGMVLATNGFGTAGPLLWLLVGPVFLWVAFWSFRAAGDGHWSPSTVVPALASVAATVALAGAFWVAVARDQVGVPVPEIGVFWALGALCAVFSGVAVAVSAAPSFVRGGMRRDWALTLGFFAGLMGAVPLAFALLTGAVPLLGALALVWWVSRIARTRRQPVPQPV